MADLHIRAAERALQLDIVVAGHAEGDARFHHAPHEVDDADDIWPAIHQIAEEDDLAPVGMAPTRLGVGQIAELIQQLLKLVAAAVDVADDVERAGLRLAVGPQRRALDADGVNRLRRAQDRHLAEALALQPAQALAQQPHMVAHDVWAELAVGTRGVALQADRSSTSRTMAMGKTSCSRAMRTSGARSCGLTLVASITVSRPSPRRSPAM